MMRLLLHPVNSHFDWTTNQNILIVIQKVMNVSRETFVTFLIVFTKKQISYGTVHTKMLYSCLRQVRKDMGDTKWEE